MGLFRPYERTGDTSPAKAKDAARLSSVTKAAEPTASVEITTQAPEAPAATR